MTIRQLHKLLFYCLLTIASLFKARGQDNSTEQSELSEITCTGISYRKHFNSWESSLNPAGIQYTPIDSLLETRIIYSNRHHVLAAVDQPDKTMQYGGTAEGYKRLGKLQLCGGMGWQQDRLKGQSWNYLVYPGSLVTAGDSLSVPHHFEQYSIYGKAAYAFSSRLLAGLSGAYTATKNKDASPEGRYSGNAYITTFSIGLIYTVQSIRTGLSASFEHRTESFSSGSDNNKRLYTFPSGYFIPMTEFSFGTKGTSGSSTKSTGQYRSITNGGQAALQAEWIQANRKWFNELNAGYECRSISPDYTSFLYGWKEQAITFGYHSRLAIPHGRWIHLLTPALSLQRTRSDRILQSPTLLRFAARHTAKVSVGYELAHDYTPDGPSRAWQLTASLMDLRDKYYSYPYTIAQLTGTIRIETAFLRHLDLPHARHLMVRPSVSLQTGYGTEEHITREENKAEVEMGTLRNYERVSSRFAALTATRLQLGMLMEYRRPLIDKTDGGLRIQAEIEQIIRNKTNYRTDKTGGGITFSLIVWI